MDFKSKLDSYTQTLKVIQWNLPGGAQYVVFYNMKYAIHH